MTLPSAGRSPMYRRVLNIYRSQTLFGQAAIGDGSGGVSLPLHSPPLQKSRQLIGLTLITRSKLAIAGIAAAQLQNPYMETPRHSTRSSSKSRLSHCVRTSDRHINLLRVACILSSEISRPAKMPRKLVERPERDWNLGAADAF